MAFSFAEAIVSVAACALARGERGRSDGACNPLSTRAALDAFPVYAELHDRAPVHRSRLLNARPFGFHIGVDVTVSGYRRFGSDTRKGALTAGHAAQPPSCPNKRSHFREQASDRDPP